MRWSIDASLLMKFGVLFAMTHLLACLPAELNKARQAIRDQDYATGLALYEKVCADHPKDQLWHEEFNAAVRQLKDKVMDDKLHGPDPTLSHHEVDLIVTELLRRKDLEGAAAVLFKRAELNVENRHLVDGASYLLRAGEIVPHQDQRQLYERQAFDILLNQATPEEALPLAVATVQEKPKDVRWCEVKATLLAKHYDYDAAIAEFTRCQELNPDDFNRQLRFGAQIAVLEAYKKREAKRK